MFDRSYRAMDYEFRIRSTVAGLGALADQVLAPFRANGREARPEATYSLDTKDNGRLDLRLPSGYTPWAESLLMALDFIVWDINRGVVERLDGFLALHSGAVAWDGRGVVLPAPPNSGKTTLTAGLTAAGFDYLTDEAALLDAEGQLHPFPRPFTMSPESVEAIQGLRDRLPPEYREYAGPQFQVAADQLRPGAVGKPCRVAYVVAPRYERGGPTALEAMSRTEALLWLAENSFNFRKFGPEGLQILGDVLREAECYRLRIGDLDSAVQTVMDLVGEGNGGR